MNVDTKEKIDKQIQAMKSQTYRNIRFEKEWCGEKYLITISKPTDLEISVFLSDCIFFGEFQNMPFFSGNDERCQIKKIWYNIENHKINPEYNYYDSMKLTLIKVLNIVKVSNNNKVLFKRFENG